LLLLLVHKDSVLRTEVPVLHRVEVVHHMVPVLHKVVVVHHRVPVHHMVVVVLHMVVELHMVVVVHIDQLEVAASQEERNLGTSRSPFALLVSCVLV